MPACRCRQDSRFRTGVCTVYYENKAQAHARHRAGDARRTCKKLEQATGAKLGSADNPLLVSVRSGAKFSMPGMMDTILNLGLNDVAVEGLKKRTNNGRFAYDSYRRFIQMFGSVVLEIPKAEFEHELEAVKKAKGVNARSRPRRGGAARGRRALQEGRQEQDEAATFRRIRSSSSGCRATRCSAPGRIRAPRNTAASTRSPITSARPSTCRRWSSATRAIGRAPASASRAIPPTGAKEFYGEFLINAQGEDVVAGIRTPKPIASSSR